MQLVAEYQEKAKELLPQYDRFGMLIEESLDAEDPWKARKALATTLRLMSPIFSPVDVKTFFDLLINGEALGDRSQSVRSEMLEVCTIPSSTSRPLERFRRRLTLKLPRSDRRRR